MTLFASYTREQLRQSYVDAWAKRLARLPQSPLEITIADVIEQHPEYQVLISDPGAALNFNVAAEGNENPYLHLGLHLAIREQISTDRPLGIRKLLFKLKARLGEHPAEHCLMDALAETLWDAQRAGIAPDEANYLARASRALFRNV